MKETRAIVAGFAVLLVVVLVWGILRRPAAGMHRVRAFHIEIHGQDHGQKRNVSLRIPGFLVGKAVSMASRAWEEGRRHGAGEWDFDGKPITPGQILEAAAAATPGHPGQIKPEHGEGKIEVHPEGSSIFVSVSESGRDTEVEIHVPRALLESLAKEEPISPRELLARIDQMGPGDLVVIKSEDSEVRLSAEGK